MKIYTKNRLESQIMEEVCTLIDDKIRYMQSDIDYLLEKIEEEKKKAADCGDLYTPSWREETVEGCRVQIKYLEDLVEFLSTEYRSRKG